MRRKVNLLLSALITVCLSVFLCEATLVNAEENVIYHNDFNDASLVSFGDFTVTEGHLVSTGDFHTANLDLTGVTVPDNFVLSYDITYPTTIVDAYAGFNIKGMTGADINYEFTVQKVAEGGYALMKDPTGAIVIHSNDLGTNPAMTFETANHVEIAKLGEQFTLTVNGAVVYNYYIADAKAPNNFSLYTYAGGQTGIQIDNVKIVENTAKKTYTTQYEQDFEDITSWGSYTIENGVAISNGDYNESGALPLSSAPTASFVIEYDVKFPATTQDGYVGLHLNGLKANDQVVEVTFEKIADNGGFTLIKNNGEFISHSNGGEGCVANPVVEAGAVAHVKIVKIGSTIQMYVNDVLSIEKVLEGTRSYRTVNFYTYAGGITGIEVDNLSIREYNPNPTVEREPLWMEDFTGYTEDALLGSQADGFKVIAEQDMAISETTFSSSGYLAIPEEAFKSNMSIEFDAYFPEVVADGYMGVYVGGIVAGEYEFTIQKTNSGIDYALIKGADGATLEHTGATGKNPVLNYNELNHVAIQKYGDTISLVVNGKVCIELYVENAGDISTVRFYSYNAIEGGFTNIAIYDYEEIPQVSAVEVVADKTAISTKQFSTLSATLLPEGAKTLEYAWYVNDELVEGATKKNYKFVPEAEGTYVVKAVVDGVTSNEVTITVTAPSQEELNSIYFDNFDAIANDSSVGSFVVQDGKLTTNTNYHEYKISDYFTIPESWEFSMDVIFDGVHDHGAYAGLKVGNIEENAYEVEFNLHKVPIGCVDEDGNLKDDLVISKWAGTEKYFNNLEPYGKNPKFNMELGQVYTLRVVKWQDQLEVYVNGVLQIKTYISNPTDVSYLTIFVYDGFGSEIRIDNVMVKDAEEITDKVLPPVIEVTSAYVSTNKVIAEAGTEVTLTANCYPFNATPSTFQWYVNGELIEGATEKDYVFKTDVAGEYVFKCVVDGDIESETKTITINAKAPAEDPTPTPTPTPTPDKEKGCGGSVIASLFGVVALAGAVLVVSKRRKDQ